MKAERQQKEATSRILQQWNDGGHIVDRRSRFVAQNRLISNIQNSQTGLSDSSKTIQLDYNIVSGNKKNEHYSYELGDSIYSGPTLWAISDDLTVTITIADVKYTIPAPSEIHDRPLQNIMKGNHLVGGITVIYNGEGGIEQSLIKFTEVFEPHKYEGTVMVGVAHSEFQFLLSFMEVIAELLLLPSVHGIILEFRQTNSPCANCQKIIAATLRQVERRTGKQAILRASALKRYDSAGGPIGEGLHWASHHGANEEHGYPDMTEIHGIHKTI